MPKFKIHSSFKPKGDQPQAIKKLLEGMKNNKNMQTLLGVTGSGKTFTMANVISKINKPTIILAHNKTLAAQLYNEFKDFFPENRVEYFVSYYDYFQPESYIPSKNQYIEKNTQVNPKIEQLRLSATASLLSRKDTIVIASVSAIYSVGNPQNFKNLGFELKIGQKIKRNELLTKLINIQFERNDTELMPGRFRVRGDTIDIIPGYFDNIIRIEMFGNIIERIAEVDKTTNSIKDKFKYFYIYPTKHFVVPEEEIDYAINEMKKELELQLPNLDMIEAHRLKQRTLHDIEMIKETGFCKGIENYSRFFEHREKGVKPFCLLDYFGDDFLILIDESHQTLPQIRGMYNGDFARKSNLVNYGFRLPSALDNRPIKFNEFEDFMKKQQVVFLSATPADYEKDNSKQIVEQIIRPTGLVDPIVTVKKTKGQIEDLKKEIENTIKKGNRILLTTLTKKLAEELTDYLATQNIKTRYLHSDVETLERTEIIRQLRAKEFDVLVGINLLREGLDLPEVGFIGILDADKEGFLRDARSLIQIIGRAARNVDSKVFLYADKMTDSMRNALSETKRRREIQIKHNKEHNITPKTIIKKIPEKVIEIKDTKHIPKKEAKRLIPQIEKEMKEAANKLNFELAIALRDRLNSLKERSK